VTLLYSFNSVGQLSLEMCQRMRSVSLLLYSDLLSVDSESYWNRAPWPRKWWT